MSRQHKITVVIFSIGVLLCGIGTGITFTEFGSLTYGGRQVLGETDIVTKDLDVEFEPDEEARDIVGINGFYQYGDLDIQTDNSVPVDTVRFHVTYNANRVEPFAETDEDGERILFGCCRVGGQDEMALMMEAKDIVLQNLKEGKLVSFDAVEMKGVTVLVNPKCEEDVRVLY